MSWNSGPILPLAGSVGSFLGKLFFVFTSSYIPTYLFLTLPEGWRLLLAYSRVTFIPFPATLCHLLLMASLYSVSSPNIQGQSSRWPWQRDMNIYFTYSDSYWNHKYRVCPRHVWVSVLRAVCKVLWEAGQACRILTTRFLSSLTKHPRTPKVVLVILLGCPEPPLPLGVSRRGAQASPSQAAF